MIKRNWYRFKRWFYRVILRRKTSYVKSSPYLVLDHWFKENGDKEINWENIQDPLRQWAIQVSKDLDKFCNDQLLRKEKTNGRKDNSTRTGEDGNSNGIILQVKWDKPLIVTGKLNL